jgi:pristinamycin I synthase-3/4
MMPAAVVVIDAVPVTPNGKIDVDALPVPAFGVADGFVPSHNATEELLCRLWAETLTVPHVGVTDDFFEHGGHSLVATQLVSRIRDALHVELPLRTLFEVPTPAGIAEVLRTDPAAAARIDRAAEVVLRVMDLSTEDLARLTEQHPDVDS